MKLLSFLIYARSVYLGTGFALHLHEECPVPQVWMIQKTSGEYRVILRKMLHVACRILLVGYSMMLLVAYSTRSEYRVSMLIVGCSMLQVVCSGMLLVAYRMLQVSYHKVSPSMGYDTWIIGWTSGFLYSDVLSSIEYVPCRVVHVS